MIFINCFCRCVLLFLMFSIAGTSGAEGQELDSMLTEILQPHFDKLDGMVKRHEVRVLVHWSKTDYFVENGEQKGIAWEMARDFEKFLNAELHTGKKPVSVIIVPVSRDKQIEYLEEGRGEMSFTFMHETPALRGRVDFSAPIDDNVSEIIMRNKKSPSIRSEKDLSGKTIHLRATSTYLSTLTTINASLKANGLREARIKFLSEHLADSDILELMDGGLIDYTILDDYRGAFWASVFPRVVAEIGHPLAEKKPISFMLRTGTPRLKSLLDRFIASHKIGTTYGNVLFKRYFKTNRYARTIMGSEEHKRFHTLTVLFQRYGKKYGFDHLMLMAQGFQESRLDQNLKSHSGAIGVMQVMPATGRALKVGDIRKLEPNIHAGVKYMKQLSDSYFSDPSIDTLNRTLLCFAAYNAGPSRIGNFRLEAKRYGLDQNLWFDHVERVVAEKGSRETVQYVMNISKYYVAYKLLQEQSARREADKQRFRHHKG
jgi:membrane-bound lytic murein transglycosylase MltF